MIRPLKVDRGSVAKTHVRISLATKRLIDDLRLKHGFATRDQVLRYYLLSNVADNRPIFHSARKIYDLTKREPYNSMIKNAANNITTRLNKSNNIIGLDKSKPKPVYNKRSWQLQPRRKF